MHLSDNRDPRPAALAALTLSVLLFAFAGFAHAQPCVPGTLTWVPRGSYAGLEFTQLVSPPGNPCVIAWTALNNGGLGVSTDCGAQYANLLLTNAHEVTASSTNTGYVAAGPLGVVKTVDTGGLWFQINDGLPPSPDARSVFIHVAHPESVFTGLYNGGVFIGGPSVDSLIQWTPINEGLTDLRVRALARVRGGSFMLAATDGGIWRRTNHVWSLVAPGAIANSFVIDSADSNRCYAACESGVFRSTNQGVSWSPSTTGIPFGTPVNDIARRTEGVNVLYIGTRGQGVFESTDYGATWHRFGPPTPGDNDVRAVLAVVGLDNVPGQVGVFAGTRANGLFLAEYCTPALQSTWGRLKDQYRE
ncbi:MAG: WD40/YVTN/BNR-like repeat-containing protein [Candidatus Eiseniibacteriota bacterium]